MEPAEPTPLRVLILEDCAAEAEMSVKALRQAGFAPEWQRATTAAEFDAHLAPTLDLILAEVALPAFGALPALRRVQEQGLDIPLIVITGAMGAEGAAECMRAGAADYLLKDRMARLGPAITAALEQRRLRRQKHQAEEMRNAAQERLHYLLLHSPAVIYAYQVGGPQPVLSMISENITQLLGFGVGETLRLNWWQDHVHPDDQTGASASLEQALVFGLSRAEYRLRHKRGFYVWIEDNKQYVPASETKPAEIVGVWTDITRRKQAAQRVEVFSGLGHQLSSAKTARDVGRVVAQAADRLIGWDACAFTLYCAETDEIQWVLAVDMIGGQRREVPLEDKATQPTPFARRILEAGAQLVLRETSTDPFPDAAPFGDKERASTSIVAVPIREGSTVIGILSIHSYTLNAYDHAAVRELQSLADHCAGALARIQAEDTMRRIEALHRRAIGAADAVPYQRDYLSRTYRFMGEEIQRLTGYSAGEMTPDLWECLVQEYRFRGELEGLRQEEATRQVREGKVTQWQCDCRIVTRQGQTRWLADASVQILNETGQPIGAIGVLQDITDRMQAQEALRQQAGLLDLTQDAILVRDLHDRVTYWNRGAERLYGWTTAEALGRKITDLIFQGTTEFEQARKNFLRRGEWSGELRQVTKTGEERIVESRWKLLRDDAHQPHSVLVTDTDITEKKRLEAQFLHAQRLESIGTLASGIAHDLNNVLAPILMAVEMLREHAADEETVKLVATLDTSARRGAEVIRQVLAFARGVGGAKTPLQPRHLLKEAAGLLRQTLPRNLNLKVRAPRELWALTGDATQLHQVLLNLAVNARDAMPEGGTLELSAANLHLDDNRASLMPQAVPGPYVVLRVRDTGTGIPPEIRARIFDPFFTTKGVGKGTGLGLSTVMGIVKSHGGFVHVESQVGQGTTFHVYLPATPAPPAPAAPTLSPASDLPRGHGQLILVVDDEEAIRQVTARTLEKHGYTVTLAADGAEALTRYSLERDRIKAVITDIAMPNMDGVALIRELHKLEPGLKIIASSGVASDLDQTSKADQPSFLEVGAFLLKPYTTQTLLKTLADLLAPSA